MTAPATPERPKRELLRIPIPPYAKPQQCRSASCGQTIYWAEHPNTGKMHPVSVKPTTADGLRPPTPTTWGEGVSHFIDCPDRQRFSGRKQK